MRFSVILGVFLLILPATLKAETQYVKEIREITLRTGPGTQFKITAMIKSGRPVTVIEQTDDWTRIQLESGKEGWVLKRFLQKGIPDRLALAELRQKHQALLQESKILRQENLQLKETTGKIGTDLASNRKSFEELSASYELLKKASSDFLTLQTDYKKTSAQLAKEKSRADQFENELATLYNDRRMTWFLTGAGVLVIGIIIGFITKPQRRRSVLR